MPNYNIYADNHVEGYWFRSLSKSLINARVISIGSRGSNPRIIDQLIEYDRPDIILTVDDKPKLVLEKTREVPTGHNVGQRFARIVRSAEYGVPAIVFFPFDARKHGDFTSICNMNVRLLEAFRKMREIHSVPVLAINWPVDSYYELIDDGSENVRVSLILNDYIDSGYNKDCKQMIQQLDIAQKEYHKRVRNFQNYNNPPPSVEIISTSRLISQNKSFTDPNISKRLLTRSQSLIYTINMTPGNCRREDPYTGTQFIYDYVWCRSGPHVENKHTNLILNFPLLTQKIWDLKNPNDISRKSCLWYATANAFVFSDSIKFLR